MSGIAVGSNVGPYRVLEVLSSNGIVTSCKAYDDESKLLMWVSALPKTELADPDAWGRFAEQASPLLTIPASRLCRIAQWGEQDGMLWSAYEWLDGMNASRRAQERGLPHANIALAWGAETVEALEVLWNNGLTHRFLSPASLFINDLEQVKLVHVPWGGMMLYVQGGTSNPAFMPVVPFLGPEVVAGQRCDEASDVYSLGASLYYLLSGQPPYWADDPLSLIDMMGTTAVDFTIPARYVPPPVVELLEEMMARDPDDRPLNLPALHSRMMTLAMQLGDPASLEAMGELSKDHQNYGYRGSSFDQLADAQQADPDMHVRQSAMDVRPPARSSGSATSSPAVQKGMGELPPVSGAAVPARDMPAPSGRASAVAAAMAEAAAPPKAPPAPAPLPGAAPAAASKPGISARQVVIILAAAGALLIVVAAVGIVLFLGMAKRKAESAMREAALLQAEDQIKRMEDTARDYVTTYARARRIGVANQEYYVRFGRWPGKITDLPDAGAATPDLSDAWGTLFDAREDFIASAGVDKKWDTADDLFLESRTGEKSGYWPTITIATTGALKEHQGRLKGLEAEAQKRVDDLLAAEEAKGRPAPR